MSQTTENQPWTIKRLLEWTTNFLGEHGSESGRLDAEILLAESLGCERIELYTRFDDVPEGEPLTMYREMVKRRADGTPVAYLVGYREFFSLTFDVNPAVLIPRPETEMLVIQTLDLLKQRAASNSGEKAAKLIDVGTGSGNISVSVAKHWPDCEITAVDVSEEALAVAEQNAANHQVTDKIRFVRSDIFSAVDVQTRFDFVISNPPYIGTAETEIEVDVKKHEPHLALFAGMDGMEVIVPLASQAARFLKSGGHLLFEISPFIETKCHELLDSIDDFEDVRILNDLSNFPRVAIAQRK